MGLDAFLDAFPYEEARDQQVEILDFLDKSDKLVTFVDAPTGVGKSAIAASLAFSGSRAYILTSTKLLQDQYKSEFAKMKVLKGKGNYTCGINKAFTVDIAPCITVKALVPKCIAKGICPYYKARDISLNSPGMVTSYSYFLMASECGPIKDDQTAYDISGKPRKREYLICDEGHEMENHLVEFSTIRIDRTDLSGRGVKIPALPAGALTGDRSSMVRYLYEVGYSLEDRMESLYQEAQTILDNASTISGNWESMPVQAAKQAKNSMKQRDYLDRISKRIKIFSNAMDDGEEKNWILNMEDSNVLMATPIYPTHAFMKYVVPLGEKIVIMSASLGAPDKIARELGVPAGAWDYISVGSPFDPRLSPVYALPVLSLSYKAIDSSLPVVTDMVNGLMDDHPNAKGIIHAGNYKICSHILSNISPKNRSRLIGKGREDQISNEELVQRHYEEDEPTVLVSPSMYTGVDLKGDMSRFQIVVKLPWSSLKDLRVKAKKDNDSDWYSNDMLKKLIQSCGRSTRSVDDHSETYILDKSFLSVWNYNKHLLPSWFRDRVEWI